jgi:hypothetical protein
LFPQISGEAEALGLPEIILIFTLFWMFSRFRNIEEFERAINSRTTNINLDLNNDNQVDYISVFSYDQGQFHSIVLRVVSSSEYQDVAVIEVVKNSGRVIVQVIGDEALYGRGYIVEPSYSRAETSNPAYTG